MEDKGQRSLEFIDAMIMGSALAAYRQIQGDDAHYRKGFALWKRNHVQEFGALLETFVYDPYINEGKAPALKVLYQKLFRLKQPQAILNNLMEFMGAFSVWLTRNMEFLDTMDPKGRISARNLSKVGFTDDPKNQLAKLAPIRFVSGKAAGESSWVDKAAKNVGVVVDEQDQMMMELGEAGVLGEQLATLDRKIAIAADGTAEEAALQEQKAAVAARLQEMREDSGNPDAVTTAAAAARDRGDPVAQYVEKYRLTPEQEDIARSTGKVVVDAGAGSGKTSTLAAWVEIAAQVHGIDPDRICAVSFTNKASGEIKDRIKLRSGIEGDMIGRTSHSLAGRILSRFADKSPTLREKYGTRLFDENGRVNRDLIYSFEAADKLWDIAMKQVEMTVEAFGAAQDAREDLITIMSQNRWAIRNIQAYAGILAGLEAGRVQKMTDKMLALVLKFTRDPDAKREIQRASDALNRSGMSRTAAPAKAVRSKYENVPAGQRFNLGATDLVDPETEREYSSGSLKLIVDNFRNAGISIDEAWNTAPTKLEAAAYEAYEWLKTNDTEVGPAMDFNDMIIGAFLVMHESESARKVVQRQYDMVAVDEAQDLNEIQFKFFMYVGGRARIQTFIGDGDQSIYAFRGAAPKNFLALAKDYGFTRKSLTVNFRSGSAIVDTAQRLIEINTERYPKVCKAHPSKGEGEIRAKVYSDHELGAEDVVAQIKDGIDGGGSPSDYGILARNHAEYESYLVQLIANGIPYRLIKGRTLYFEKPIVRGLIDWMNLAVGGPQADVSIYRAHKTPGFGLDSEFERRVEAIRGRQSPTEFLLGGENAPQIYTGNQAWRNARAVEPYLDAIKIVQAARGNITNLLETIFATRGSKKTFKESLIDKVNQEDLVEDSSGEKPSPDAVEAAAMAPLRPIIMLANNAQTASNFVNIVEKLKAVDERVQKGDKDDAPAVLVGTVHGWKGLEADHVFVIMAGGVFPSGRTQEEAEENEESPDPSPGGGKAMQEERRLAYVAITRGRKNVTVVSPIINYRNKRVSPSRFIEESCLPLYSGGKGPDLAAEAEIQDIEGHHRAASDDDDDVFALNDEMDGDDFLEDDLVREWNNIN